MKKYFQLYAVPKTLEVLSEVFSMPSKRMIKTLKACLLMESSHPGKPYGPADIGGSFLQLYKKGFVDVSTDHGKKSKPGSWYVTSKGVNLFTAISSHQIGSN